MRVNTSSFEATQGHKPHGYGEWSFKFYNNINYEVGSAFASWAFFTDALEGAKVYAESLGATRIEVVA